VAIKGVGGDKVPLVSPPTRTATYHSPLYKLGVDRFKQVIYDRLNIPRVGPGYVHIPETLQDEFWQQLTAESPEVRVEHGRQVTRWVQHRPRNEALDCAVYALAAYEMFCHPMPRKKR
jgi:phage terminase large subunit GpA-like protein